MRIMLDVTTYIMASFADTYRNSMHGNKLRTVLVFIGNPAKNIPVIGKIKSICNKLRLMYCSYCC